LFLNGTQWTGEEGGVIADSHRDETQATLRKTNWAL